MVDFDNLSDGFYWLFSARDCDVSLVKLYTPIDPPERGIGFGRWDGAGFIPLGDLTEDSQLRPAFPLDHVRVQLKIQGESGNWDFDPYMHGMYNGLECALATMEGRDPEYRDAPQKWLYEIDTTDEPEATQDDILL